MRWGPLLWALVSAALFGAATPASKVLLEGMGPLVLAGLLYLGAALAVLPFSMRGGSPEQWRSARNLRRVGGAVLFGGVLGPIALLYGLALAPSASVSLWLNLETVATAVLAWLFFREHVGARVWVANLGVVAAGVVLAAPGGFSLAPAAGLVLLACVFWGLDNNLTAVIDGFTPEQSTLVKGVVAGAVNLGLGLALGQSWPSSGHVLGALGVGALGYGASIVLYIRSAQHLGATRSQMVFSSAPFFGVALAWIALGEPIGGAQIVGSVLIVGALGLMLSARHGHEHHHHPVVHTHAHRHDDGHHDHGHGGRSPEGWHTHEHAHDEQVHSHAHEPDLHHRHEH